MKTTSLAILFILSAITSFCQNRDSVKSAGDLIIESENKRTVTPNKVKPELKTIIPSEEKEKTAKKKKDKRCCLFCKKKKKSL